MLSALPSVWRRASLPLNLLWGGDAKRDIIAAFAIARTTCILEASITSRIGGSRDCPDRGSPSSGSALRGGVSHESPICRVRSRGRQDAIFQDATPPILRAGSWALIGTSPSTNQTVGPTNGTVTLSSDGDTIDVLIHVEGCWPNRGREGTRNLDAARVWVLTMASWLDYKGKSARQGF